MTGIGMDYNEVRKKIVKINKEKYMHPEQKNRLRESLFNQARLREGSKAERELRRELRG
jgi:hypothetical protein